MTHIRQSEAPTTAARSAPHLPLLDGTRAIAAFMVLLTHVGAASGATERSWFGPFLARGDWGVALFFVLSGFLLTRPWVRWRLAGSPAPRIGSYLRKRAVRILPAYWLALAAVLLLLPQQVTGLGVVSNALLLQVYTGPLLDGFFQSWSLCTEVAFYALLPLLGPLVIRRSVRWSLTALTVLALLTPIWILLCQSWAVGLMPPYAIIWLPGHLAWFCAGMALAVLERWWHTRPLRNPESAVPAHGWLGAAVVCFALALTPLAGPYTWADAPVIVAISKELLYGATAFFLVGALLQPRAAATLWGRGLNSRLMGWLGLLSYAFFLWHNLIIELLRKALDLPFGGGGFWITLLGATALTLVVSQASYSLIEHPLMQRLAHPRRPTTPPGP